MTPKGKWIDWQGGDCPVDLEAPVEVRYRNPRGMLANTQRVTTNLAGVFGWAHTGAAGDIIAYRALKGATK